MTIAHIIEHQAETVVSCTVDCTVRDAARALADKRIGALPVMDGGTIAGIFSERDLLYCIAARGAAVLDEPVAGVMTSPPITVAADADVLTALSLMTRRRIRHLPVVAAGRMVGFVSIGDLVAYRMRRIEREAEQLRDYIRTA